ncbi:MAG TPA: exodeoxyribonuclease V subunit alpha [Casimicrobiaceae bacterium]
MMPERDIAPEQWLAHGFAERVARWARERDAPKEAVNIVQEAAYRTSAATSSGHVCVPLGEIEWPSGADAVKARARLLETHVVGTPAVASNLPLILDDENRLYLHRYFDYERRFAARLMHFARAPLDNVSNGPLRSRLNRLFAGNAKRFGDRPDWQKLAVALSMLHKLTIISGGPGTGKTTTIVNLLICLLEQSPECRIALAAPTGKAAARMLDAIRAQSAALPPEIVARFPGDPFTIHRLLGMLPSGEFRHDAGNPLPIDVLVVDEASMLDLALATRLFEAVPDAARVILLGDKDQLAAVEAGAVFSEICADPTLSSAMRERLAELTGISAERIAPPTATEATPLHDSVVWFRDNFRFAPDSGIGRLAAEINAGHDERTLTWLRSQTNSSVTWLEDATRVPQAATMMLAYEAYAAYLDAVRSAPTDRVAIFAAFARFRVLCAERQGPRGVSGINDALAHWFREALAHPLDAGPRSPWYPGRPVMILRNEYVLKLFNGDVGIVLPDDDGDSMVHFADADGTFRAIAPARLPEHDTAFAMTVHKAQGSEFDHVMLMLPSGASRVVTRELLYTAVTRARQRVVIVGDAEVMAHGVDTRTTRHSGLIERMRGSGELAQ